MDAQPPQAIPAASMIIMRERENHPPEVLMIERSASLTFAGGLTVFPGGRVDPQDRALAATLNPLDMEETAARIAAIRETIEEVGLPIGLRPVPDQSQIDHIRDQLHKGVFFADLLRIFGLELVIDALVPWSRWQPAHAHKRIFDTRFYLARCPPLMPEASVHPGESTRLMWASAAGMLIDAEGGALKLMYPTRRNLERLARCDTFAAAEIHARSTPAQTITPWFENRDGVEYLCIPQDAGYPVTSQAFDTVVRG